MNTFVYDVHYEFIGRTVEHLFAKARSVGEVTTALDDFRSDVLHSLNDSAAAVISEPSAHYSNGRRITIQTAASETEVAQVVLAALKSHELFADRS